MNKKKRSVFRTPKKRSLFNRIFRKLVFTLFGLCILVGGTGYWILSASRPSYNGEQQLAALRADVEITRDKLGTLSITAENRLDLASALGWSHGQERFFQMDLLRRRAAGELSEIIGSATVEVDKKTRIHRFRHRAKRIYEQLESRHRQILKAYTQGVNAGLNNLSTSPFEYWLLQTEPQPWQEEDSILVVFAMYLQLQHSSAERERVLQQGFQNLPEPIFDFLLPHGTEFDAPIDFSEIALPPVPTNVKLNDPTGKPLNKNLNHTEGSPGSNSFAINGPRVKGNSAMVASDMHLGLSVPNIWMKANLQYSNNSQVVQLKGVSLPGSPLLIAGTNHHIAWSFTNSYGDYSDAFALKLHPDDPNLYRYQGEWHEFHFANEVINVKNAAAETLTIKQTMLGPVDKQSRDIAWAFMWIAHDTNAINFNLINLETATSAVQTIELAPEISIPAQNLVVADSQGNIGWTIIGPLPQRSYSDNPFTTIKHTNGVIEWLKKEQYPKIINPESHALWTANGRIVGGKEYLKIGNGGYAMGARGKIIKNKLLDLSNANEKDLLAIQLETEALLYQRWRKHLLALLQAPENYNPKYQEFISLIKQWNGKADADQAGFTLLKYYRNQLRKTLLDPWVGKMAEDPEHSISYYSKQYEYPLWKIIQKQPKIFLPASYQSYNGVMMQSVDKVIQQLTQGNRVLSDQVWGAHNQLSIQHPISKGIPALSWFLDRKRHNMPGDVDSPRVQKPKFGASQRMVIAPNATEHSIFHMPGGQSGHPLSEFYETGFEHWVKGTKTPLTASEPIHKLILKAK